MAKGIIKNYTFSTSAKTITLTDITTIRLDKLALITDTTTNKILYNFADSTVATATVSTNVITLSTLQGGESNSDKLRIDYDIESSDTSAFADTTQPVSISTVPLPTGAATSTKQSDGTQKTQVVDGSGNVIGSTTNALDINIKSGNPTSITANAGTNLNTSALALDATLTGGTQQTKLTDGTNIANILKSDGTAAGQNAQLVAPTYKEVGSLSAGSLNADLVTSTDVSGYSTFVLQVAGTWVGTLTLQGSNDNANFVSVYGVWISNTQPVLTMTSNGIMTGSCNFRYFRVRMTAYTSGSATGTLELKSMPFTQTNMSVLGNLTPTNATTSAIPAVAMPAGFKALSADQTATTTTYNTQGITDLVGKQIVMPYALNQLFVKGSASATGTSSTSLIAAGAAGIKNYITSISIANTGTSTSLITLQDGSGGTTLLTTIAPAGGGSNITLPVPIATSAATALYFAAGTASTTIYLTAVGYTGV